MSTELTIKLKKLHMLSVKLMDISDRVTDLLEDVDHDLKDMSDENELTNKQSEHIAFINSYIKHAQNMLEMEL